MPIDLHELGTKCRRLRVEILDITVEEAAQRTGIEAGRRKTICVLADDRLQTTPQLLAWLYISGHLTDSDVEDIVREHNASNGDMAKDYREAHLMACEKRLMQRLLPVAGKRMNPREKQRG